MYNFNWLLPSNKGLFAIPYVKSRCNSLSIRFEPTVYIQSSKTSTLWVAESTSIKCNSNIKYVTETDPYFGSTTSGGLEDEVFQVVYMFTKGIIVNAENEIFKPFIIQDNRCYQLTKKSTWLFCPMCLCSRPYKTHKIYPGISKPWANVIHVPLKDTEFHYAQ